MANTNTPTPSVDDLLPTVEQFLANVNVRFADNKFGLTTEADFRATFAELAQVFADWRHLSVKRVKGATFPVPFTDSLGLVPANYRILGMQAVALNGVDSGTAATGVIAPQVFFTLLKDSTGPVNALLDTEATTTLTVKARWVQTSGTDEDKLVQFEWLELEDRDYAAGDVVKYQFPNNAIRLLMWRADSVGFQHPVPTGEDSDPIYAPFALPVAAAAGVSQASFDALEGRVAEAESDIVDLQNGRQSLATTVGALDDLRTTTKTSLVSATNEVLGRIPVAYTRLGFASDGYLTQGYATTILATKAATAFTPNYQVEVAAGGTLSPGLNGGKSYTLNETNVQLDNPATDPSSYGKVDLYRVIGQRAAKLTATAPATIDGNPSVAFQPGEWFVLRQQAGGHTIVMRGSTLTPTPGAGTTYTAGAGIAISAQNVISATATPSTEDPRKELVTENGRRTNNLRREAKSHLSNLLLAENAASVAAQVLQGGNATAPARTGTPAAVAAAINADVDALTDFSLYTIRLITTATTPSNPSAVLLTILPA